MAGESVEIGSASREEGDATKYERSTIEFPYGDLSDAIGVADAIHENAGVACSTDQLSAYLKQSPTSGAFRSRMSAARMFGLTVNERREVALTDLGRKIVDPEQRAQARADAFLNVELYRAIFEKYQGHLLPPTAALERELVSLGVSKKQASRARQIFERSADQAGYREHGKDRLVRPAFRDAPKTLKIEESREEGGTGAGGGTGSGGGGSEYHPFIQGLLLKLPAPETEWSIPDRAKWLQTAAQIFGLIYKDNGGSLTVTILDRGQPKEGTKGGETGPSSRPESGN